ncbi:hypothetical protein [Maribacter halichondriae]|uniref:hypothetical protein n=1 Tax=Maribacter halichondriae TaxID=2980554 RepID=UPI0023583892|nr:hypothetical protein [Maribacter sp. Hal144]
MNPNTTHTKTEQTKKVEDLHADCRNWKSKFRFLDDEFSFIERLLNSYVFEPNTPNLFERLQDYLSRLKKVKANKVRVLEKISNHENDLGGMLECTDDTCDLRFYQKHDALEAEVVFVMEDFQYLKSEIFNYAGGILKKRKRDF